MSIKFGPAGNSESFYEQGHKASVEAPKWISELGLSAFEYSFGRGVRISDELAANLNEQTNLFGITLSVHCPYYINLATDDEQKHENNWNYLLNSVVAGIKMGATRAVLHPGSAAKVDRSLAFERNLKAFAEFKQRLKSEGLDEVLVCPETMGKINQLGDLDEVLQMCNVDEVTVPVIDFGHLNSRTFGGIKGRAEYLEILDKIQKEIGIDRAKLIHVHFSKIEYGKSGEIKHLTFADEKYGPEFEPLLMEIAERDWQPTIICESKGTMAEDALTMKKTYEKYKKQ